MANGDGKVVISTKLDNSGLKKDLKEVSGEFGGLGKTVERCSRSISGAMSKPVSEACAKIQKDISATERRIKQYQQQIQKAESAKMPLVEQAEQLGVELDTAKAKLTQLQAQQQAAGNILSATNGQEMSGADVQSYLNAYEQKPQLDADVAKQQAQVDALQKKWDTVNDKIDAYNSKIHQANREMEEQKGTAAELAQKLDSAEKKAKKIRDDSSGAKKGFSSVGKAVDSFASRLKSIALGALIFNGISAGLREFTSYLGQALKTNDAFRTELAQLKGALLTAFQPIYNAVAPALTSLMQILTKATLVVAQFFATLTGTTLEASASAAAGLYEEANGLKAVGSAAKKAKKSLAGFDELTVLQDKNEASGSGGGGTDVVTPDFSVGEGIDTAQIEKIAEIFREIVGYIPVIAAGLISFKLGSFIADLLTANKEAKTLKETFSLLGKKAGLALGVTLAITGIALETKGITSAIQEGLNGINFAEILGGGGMLAGGGALIGHFFGSAILGGAIGGIVAGIPAFAVGVYDAIVGGLDWLNAALVGVGATAAGAGIGAIIGLLGGPIGAGIGALIGLAVGLVTDLIILIVQKWDEICAFFAPAAEWFDTNVIQPVGEFFSGLWTSITQLASEAWEGIKEFFTPAIEWFSELLSSIGQTFDDIFYNIGVIVSGCWEIIKVAWGIVSTWFDENVIQPVAGFFEGLWTGISEWASGAWDDICEVFNGVASWFDLNVVQPVAGFFTTLLEDISGWADDVWEDICETFNGIVDFFKGILNGIIGALNNGLSWVFGGINDIIRGVRDMEVLGISPFSGLRTISVPQIPYLAQGAVLPPNKPFMAVVGDQRHGTNVEAPLATIQEAVALVMQDQTQAILAGFEASVGVQREILEAVLGIQIGDDVIGNAVSRYNHKQAVIRGGVL